MFGKKLDSNIFFPPFKDETPTPTFNSVCFIKPDKHVFADCQSTVAVSNKFICYTVRKTFLRVIQTQSAQTQLLRGHSSSVVEMKFSVVDDSLLYSIDNGTPENTHLYVWKLVDSGKELSFSILYKYKTPGILVRPSPLSSTLCGVSRDYTFALIRHIPEDNGLGLPPPDSPILEDQDDFITLKEKVIGKYLIFVECI